MTKDQLIVMAKEAAAAHGIDPALVCAVCHHESAGWKRWAVRYEPGFYRRYVQSMDLRETEKITRSTSYGLMQVMGQVAREFGFHGEYLSELLDPRTNLAYGCRKLADCLTKTKGDVRAALMRYNGGGIPNYPDLVLRHIDQYK